VATNRKIYKLYILLLNMSNFKKKIWDVKMKLANNRRNKEREHLTQICRDTLIKIQEHHQGDIETNSNKIISYQICDYFSHEMIDQFEVNGKDLSSIRIIIPVKKTIEARCPLSKQEMFPSEKYIQLKNGFIVESSEAEKLRIEGKDYIPNYEKYFVVTNLKEF